MISPIALPALLGATNKLHNLDLPPIGIVPMEVIIPLVLGVVGFAAGIAIANSMRLKDYGWKAGLILSALLVSISVVLLGSFKLGVDLQGGVILVYEVDRKETAALDPQGRDDAWTMDSLLKILRQRLNPDGLKEIVIRPFGRSQVEIVVPEADPNEIRRIKEIITTGGALRFMIVANDPVRDARIIERAEEQASTSGRELEKTVKDEQGNLIGLWVKAGREKGDDAPFRDSTIVRDVLRDARTGKLLNLQPADRVQFMNSHSVFQGYLDERGVKQVEVLMAYDADYDIRGEDLARAEFDRDENLRAALRFDMKGEGISKMGGLSSENVPERGSERKLGIVFDNELLSAPVIRERISEHGQITGNFEDEEVLFIRDILRSGSMPVVLFKEPISENQIGSILGQDTIIKGARALTVSLLLILCFMLVYYRFAGLVACGALILNLLLTVSIMVLLQAPFTLPGLAGLVLTVGMSVDSNVLIFERIREELARGAALRMALRNGFDRAMVTIIDSNLTTLLTAVVLYAIGTDQVRGFGTTLILGILTSMFTAIFCSRVIFEMGERSRWLKSISMLKLMTTANINWVKLFVPATVVSVVLLMIGMVATVARGKGLFDIDLVGGESVTFILKDPIPEPQVRAKIEEALKDAVNEQTNTKVGYTVIEMEVVGEQRDTVYKVDSSLGSVERLQDELQAAFKKPDGSQGLKTYRMEIGAIKSVDAPPATELKSANGARPFTTPSKSPGTTFPGAEAPKPEPPVGKEPADTPPATPAESKPTESKPTDTKPAEAKPEDAKESGDDCQEEPKAEKSDEAKTAEKNTATGEKPAAKPPADSPSVTSPASPAPATAAPRPPRKLTEATLRFPQSKISAEALIDRIQESAQAVLNEGLVARTSNPKWDGLDNSAFEEWKITLEADEASARKVLEHMQQQLASAPAWQTSSEIGGQVSKDTQYKAFTAVLISLFGIAAYVWFRFHQLSWGIAAIVSLAHDALFMLGAIAASYWLAPYFGFLMIEQFKIDLPTVAAFLTLIGYSINDTIVIFDRIREVRGKSPEMTKEMINTAVNQTLSRSIITTLTVLIVVLILYFVGGPGIHTFAFAMVVGTIAGSYSTIFIASPLLLWLMNRKPPAKGKPEVRQVARTSV